MLNSQSNPVVPELQFNVSQLLKEPTGATRHYQLNIKTSYLLGEQIQFVSPLVGTVDLLRTGRDILVTGQLKTAIEKSCDRCLTVFTAPLTIELEELFYPSVDLATGNALPPPPEADEANRITETHTLDLYEVVRQALLLENDSIRYCQPDCKGLCPHCGQDRNVDMCDCADNLIDWRLAGLLEFKTEDL